MNLKEWMVILVISSMVAFASITLVSDLSNTYGTTTNTSFISEYSDSLDTLKNSSEDLYQNVQGSEMNAGGLTGILYNSIGSFFQILINLVTLPITWLKLASIEFGIPMPIVIGITTLIIISIVFAVISAIVRKTP